MKITVTCEVCGKDFEREKGEVNRSTKLGRPITCGRSCGMKKANATRKEQGWKPPEKSYAHLTPGSEPDEFTPFRWYLSRAKQRKHEVDIDLPYLKELWESQKGICPFTGWKLTLRTSTDHRGKRVDDASLDRIDSSKGYVKGNVRFVCCIANVARNDWSDEELIHFCSSVKEAIV